MSLNKAAERLYDEKIGSQYSFMETSVREAGIEALAWALAHPEELLEFRIEQLEEARLALEGAGQCPAFNPGDGVQCDKREGHRSPNHYWIKDSEKRVWSDE